MFTLDVHQRGEGAGAFVPSTRGSAGVGWWARAARGQLPMASLLAVFAMVLAVLWQLQFRSQTTV